MQSFPEQGALLRLFLFLFLHMESIQTPPRGVKHLFITVRIRYTRESLFVISMSMKKNVGGIDRTVRIVVGILVIGLGLMMNSWWGLLGVVLLLTGLFRFCGLYTLLGINTCPIDTPPPTPPEVQQ